MPIDLLEVVRIFDETTTPAKRRMIACIHVGNGWFFRINSKRWQTPVLLRKFDHPFLDHDSYLECGEPLDVDDYLIDQAIAKFGILGKLAEVVVPDVLQAVDKARTLTKRDKEAIKAALSALMKPPAG